MVPAVASAEDAGTVKGASDGFRAKAGDSHLADFLDDVLLF